MSVSCVSLTDKLIRVTHCQAEVPLTVEEISFADPRCSARFEYGPDGGVGKGIICQDFSRFDTAAPAVRRDFKLENTVPKENISGHKIVCDWG